MGPRAECELGIGRCCLSSVHMASSDNVSSYHPLSPTAVVRSPRLPVFNTSEFVLVFVTFFVYFFSIGTHQQGNAVAHGGEFPRTRRNAACTFEIFYSS